MFFVLTLLHIVASKMMTMFNQSMHAQIKAKKNEPLSSIGLERPRVAEKEATEMTLSILVPP